jgi:hypothetical protein
MGGCGIAVSIISLNVGIMCLVASLSLLLVGYTQESDYVSEFATYNSATCTLVSFKVIEAEPSYGSRLRFLAVAGVTLLSSPTVYAGVMQANTTYEYDTPDDLHARGLRSTAHLIQVDIKLDRRIHVACRRTASLRRPFDEAITAPVERAVAMNFNREEAIAYTNLGTGLVIAGWCVRRHRRRFCAVWIFHVVRWRGLLRGLLRRLL